MKQDGRWTWWLLAVLAAGSAAPSHADVLTADRAVQIALQRSSSVIQAKAGVLDARSSTYGAYSQVLPNVSAGVTRAGSKSSGSEGTQLFGTVVTPSSRTDSERYSTTPGFSGSWSILDLAGLQGVLAARTGLKAARMRQSSARLDAAYNTRRQFYEVVRAVRLSEVSSSALKLSRDDERRVRALFEVGSVSRSDVLKAQVATAQSQLDSLSAAQAVINQRIALAELMGVRESEFGDVDTTLAIEPVEVDEPALRTEAARQRPDLMAADASLGAARASLRSANLARLPALTVSGSYDFNLRSAFSQKTYGTFPQIVTKDSLTGPGPGPNVYRYSYVAGPPLTDPTTSGRTTTDRSWSAQVGLTWNIFSGMATESRIATAQAEVARAEDARNVLWRNLDAEVHQAVLAYRQAVAQDVVARQAVESATENLKLTQQKYNVGSSTILDLIDAQVQLQRAQSDAVSALAGIRQADAQINRVRGRTE